MSDSSPVMRAPFRPWLSLLLVALAVSTLWLLDGRQPSPWPDAELPWSAHVDALAPASWAIDRVNAHVALSPDLPAASLGVLLSMALVTLFTLGALDLPLAITLGVALSVVFLRSTWSTVAPGLDARPAFVVSLAVLAVVRAEWPWLPPAAAVAALLLAPGAAWLVVPALLVGNGSLLRRGLSASGLVVASLALRAWQLHGMWDAVWCLPPGQGRTVVAEVLRPNWLVDISSWWSLQRTIGALRDDLHAFGLALAAVGLFSAAAPRRLRDGTWVALAVAALTSAAGLVPPAKAAVLLVPWLLPSIARGLVALTARATRHPALAAAGAGLVIAVIPALRHARVTPEPWHAGSPAIARAVSETWHGGLVATDDAALTRRLRLVGGTTVPADPRTLATCVASGRHVFALGPMVARVQALGFRADETPLHAPLGAVLADLRRGAFVALGISPGTLPFAGAQGLHALERAGLPHGVGAREAVGLLSRIGHGGDSRHGAGGVDLFVPQGTDVGGESLLASWSIAAGAGEADVDAPPERLASSRHAAIVVLDRAQQVALRTAGAPRAGLAVPLGTHALWRQVRVLGTRRCEAAGTSWTTVPPHGRISVPVSGASVRHPALAYLVSAELPELVLRGLPVDPLRPGWSARPFDRDLLADAARLAGTLGADGLATGMLGEGRFVTRLALHPASTLPQGHALVTAGTSPLRWVIRLAAPATRPEHAEVCAMPDGPRVLDGRSGPIDDDTTGELTVTTRDGWHAAERSRGSAFQWTARPVATATFRADATRDLVLALDAVGADVGRGPQPITLRVNGRIIREGWQGAGRVTIPTAALSAGVDVLSIEVAQVARPAGDGRPLGVLVRQLRVIDPTS